MRAVIYARFSTDQQSASSIEDQARVCRERAVALGLEVSAVHSDVATSGQTRIGERPGGRTLLADQFDVLLVEGLDRLSRDAIESETVVRRLEHRGVRIIGVSDGYDSEAGRSRNLLRMVRGAINEVFIDDLRAKTHRGMTGQVERGFNASGIAYGYRSVVAGVTAKGEPIGRRLEIADEQAAIVREIFARYAAGDSCQRIAAELNVRGIPGPRGGTWCVSALYGSPAKGSGVLNNELYVGRYIWNRSRWVRDPDTKRRERIDRPKAEWKVDLRPALRIIDEQTWQAVRARMGKTRAEGGRTGRGGFPTTLFGGILRCGQCGGSVVKISATSYGCAARADRGVAVCSGMTVPTRRIDTLLVEHVREQLNTPAVRAQIEREAVLLAADRGRAADTRRELGRQLASLEADARRLADAIAAAGVSPTLVERLRVAEEEIDRVKRAQTRAPVATLPSAARDAVRAILDDLEHALRGNLSLARDALRTALGEVRLQKEKDGLFAVFESTADRLLLKAVGEQMGRVAGARFELATFGL